MRDKNQRITYKPGFVQVKLHLPPLLIKSNGLPAERIEFGQARDEMTI